MNDKYGFRSWKMDSSGKLISHGAYVWKDGWNKAECLAGNRHIPPRLECACGFYSFGDLNRFFSLQNPRERFNHIKGSFYQVLGIIKHGGLTYSTNIGGGYARSRFGKIVCLLLEEYQEKYKAKLKKEYPSVVIYTYKDLPDALPWT